MRFTLPVLPVLSTVTAVAVLAGLVGVPAASAAPTHSATPAHTAARAHARSAPAARPHVASGADATLSDLSFADAALGSLAPDFAPDTHDYELMVDDNQSASVTPTTTDPSATVAVTDGGTAAPLTSGKATLPLVRGRNDIAVTVTSADHTATSTYHATLWRLAAPKPQIVNLGDTTTSVFGGTHMTITMTDGQRQGYACYRDYLVGGQYAYEDSSQFDPTTGLTRVVVGLPAQPGRDGGKADLEITTSCLLPNGYAYVKSNVTADNAVTYVKDLQVDSIDAPDKVTSATTMTLHGPYVGGYSDTREWMTNAAGDIKQMYNGPFTGNDSKLIYPVYSYGDPFDATSGPRTVHFGYCPEDQWQVDSACTSVFSKNINWVAPVPTDVSFSPSSGPQSGGTTIRLRGRFVVSGNSDLHIKVGDQEVTNFNYVEVAAWTESYAEYIEGTDILEFAAPPSATTGPVPITVSNSFGTTVARGTFTYSARPTITTVAPASVANTGGSVITLTGTNFGTAGQPTVIIGGVKSPSVTRFSATKITAAVPALTGTTGPVDVTVSSPQGGGISSAASLTLTTPATAPTVTKISPSSGHVGDDVTLTGSGFGPAGTAGVTVDGRSATLTASSATGVTFTVPSTDTPGAKDLVVSSVTGAVTKQSAFTVLPDPAINTVSPSSVASYATGAAAKIALDGYGFGTKGTVKVGSAAAVAYTATSAGTHIAGVTVPTSAAGPQAITVTPAGSSTPLRAGVTVTAPKFSYVGPDPYQASYGPTNLDTGGGGNVLVVPATGHTPMRLQGSGFGTGGVLKLGSTVVPTTSWSDTAITFVTPAHAAGSLPISVTPTNSTLSATRTAGVQYVPAAAGPPAISSISSNTDYNRNGRNEFDPQNDSTNDFTLTGVNLAGTSAAATRVLVHDGDTTFTVVPTQVTQTSLQFNAPRGVTNGGWHDVEVDTNVGTINDNFGIYYHNAGTTIVASPWSGLCQRHDVTATGSVTYHPATTTITSSSPVFGNSGTVTIGGTAFTTTSYSDSSISLDMANLAGDLADPWGGKSIVITPDDTSLPTQTVGFACQVTPGVTTTVNGGTSDVTVAAGTAFTMGYSTTGFVGTNPFTATAPSGYEYVTAADYAAHGFNSNVHNGVPAAAGEYYVRVSLSHATYDPEPYAAFAPSAVHVTITGTPLTITPASNNGAQFTYKGQLGDGTNGSSTDFHYTPSNTTDPITKVTWEYRDSACESSDDPNAGWTSGLPSGVARSTTGCGGDGTTVSSWDVRVKSFEMTTSGTDRSIYYQATFPTVQVKVTPRNLTVAGVRADKVWDGSDAATLGDLQVTGAVSGDDVQLANGAGGGTFADASPGVNKPVTLSQDLALAGSAASNYTLTNPRPTIVGTITKASAVLALSTSASSLLLSQHGTATITPTVTDSRGGAVADDAGLAAVQLVSQTPSVCSVSGTTVTPLHAGTCTIAGTQAASMNYNAATAASDPTSRTETIDIQVFPAAQPISVVADDLQVAVGDDVDPTSQIGGLFDGDSVDGVEYDYYQGSTLLQSAPTTPGTYKVVPRGGTLNAADPSVYSNPSSFTYVPGTLLITQQPATITTISPATGPTKGGTVVTITGTMLDTVRTVRIGDVTLRVGDFTVNGDGTSLKFSAPRVANPGPVTLTLANGNATVADVYTYTAPTAPTSTVPGAPRRVTAKGGDHQLTVSFQPPASDGGSKITGYQVSTDNGRTWHTVPTVAGASGTRVTTLKGLTNGSDYPVRVRAVNAVGSGPASAAAKATPHALAGSPTSVTPHAGDQHMKVTFTPPANDGGSRVTAYQVSLDGGRTWHSVKTTGSGGRRSFEVGSLTNGTTYHVLVRGVTAYGAGAASSAHSVVPNAPALGDRRPVSHSQIPVPNHPKAYHGKRRQTVAFGTSHDGTWAHEISKLGRRQMTVGEAATLDRSGLFDFDSAQLTDEGRADVKQLAGHLRLAHAITCEGYTDYAGEKAHELSLSQRRAIAVCSALKQYGANVVTTAHGYGGARPVIVGGTPQSREANRRVVVLVTK